MTLYIIPRKFDMLIDNVQFFTSFESLCGFIKFKTENAYKEANLSQIEEQLRTQVSMTGEEFTKLKDDLVKKFLTEYEGERIGTDAVTEQVNGLTLDEQK